MRFDPVVLPSNNPEPLFPDRVLRVGVVSVAVGVKDRNPGRMERLYEIGKDLIQSIAVGCAGGGDVCACTLTGPDRWPGDRESQGSPSAHDPAATVPGLGRADSETKMHQPS